MAGYVDGRSEIGKLVIALFAITMTAGCGVAGGGTQASSDPPSCSSCEAILSNTEVVVVQQTFPYFTPEEFAPNTDPNSSDLTPSNFVPAQFFGPQEQGDPAERTPTLSITVYTNGYDNPSQPPAFAAQGTYFTHSLQAAPFTLSTIQRSPLNLLQQRMGVPLTPNAATISIDMRNWRVSLSEIDQDMAFIRDQLSQVIPEIGSVVPADATITIEPSIFYAAASNYGGIWAGGLTTPNRDGTYGIQLAAFYITFDSQGNMIIVNWEDFLVDEAINFYVMSVGRSDLARVTRLRKIPPVHPVRPRRGP